MINNRRLWLLLLALIIASGIIYIGLAWPRPHKGNAVNRISAELQALHSALLVYVGDFRSGPPSESVEPLIRYLVLKDSGQLKNRYRLPAEAQGVRYNSAASQTAVIRTKISELEVSIRKDGVVSWQRSQ